MNEIRFTLKELDNLHANEPESWPNEPLKLAAGDLIKKYDETGILDEWEYETAESIVNLINSRRAK